VLCCDEKTQIQALDRTQPGLPLKRERSKLLRSLLGSQLPFLSRYAGVQSSGLPPLSVEEREEPILATEGRDGRLDVGDRRQCVKVEEAVEPLPPDMFGRQRGLGLANQIRSPGVFSNMV